MSKISLFINHLCHCDLLSITKKDYMANKYNKINAFIHLRYASGLKLTGSGFGSDPEMRKLDPDPTVKKKQFRNPSFNQPRIRILPKYLDP